MLQENGKKDALEKLMGIVAAVIVFVGLSIIVVAVWLGCTTTWMNVVGYALVAVTLLSFILVFVLRPYDGKKGIGGAVFNVASWITQVCWVVIALILPAMLLVVGFIFIVILPFVVLYGTLTLLPEIVGIKPQTVLFLSLSLGAIISVYYSKPLFAWLSRLMTMNGHRYEVYFKKMVEYVYKPVNIQYAIYFFYVVYLVVSSVYRFQTGGEPIWGNDKDLALLESFLVFIAFSNMKTRRESTQFKFFDLFKIIYAMWTTHDIIKDGDDGRKDETERK